MGDSSCDQTLRHSDVLQPTNHIYCTPSGSARPSAFHDYQQNSTDFNKLWNLVRDHVLYPETLLGSPLDSAMRNPLLIERC